MAGYIIGLINQVGRFERFRPESQVGNRSPSRLFAVVGEVCLDMQIGVASDYLDGPFVGPHRPVRAKPEEFTADGPLGQGIDNLPVRKGSIGNIVNYTDGEMIPGYLLHQVPEDRQYLGWPGVLRAQPVSSANDQRLFARIIKQFHNVKIQGLARCPRLFGPVQDSNALYSSGQNIEEMFC